MKIGNLRLALAGLGVAGTAAVLAGAGAFSVFNTTATNTTSFATGNIAITDAPTCTSYDGGTANTGTCATGAVIQGTNLVPGDEVNGSVSLTNSGGVRAAYNLGGATSEVAETPALQSELLFGVFEQKPGDTTGTCSLTWSAGSADGVTPASITGSSDCVSVYNGTWAGFNSQSINLQNAAGSAGGAWMHSEAHSFYVMGGLPLAAGNGYEAKTATATLTFTATSVASN